MLLVERSVARAAQEELLNRGISLVHHAKPELLERLARCMGVKVNMHSIQCCSAWVQPARCLCAVCTSSCRPVFRLVLRREE